MAPLLVTKMIEQWKVQYCLLKCASGMGIHCSWEDITIEVHIAYLSTWTSILAPFPIPIFYQCVCILGKNQMMVQVLLSA